MWDSLTLSTLARTPTSNTTSLHWFFLSVPFFIWAVLFARVCLMVLPEIWYIQILLISLSAGPVVVPSLYFPSLSPKWPNQATTTFNIITLATALETKLLFRHQNWFAVFQILSPVHFTQPSRSFPTSRSTQHYLFEVDDYSWVYQTQRPFKSSAWQIWWLSSN